MSSTAPRIKSRKPKPTPGRRAVVETPPAPMRRPSRFLWLVLTGLILVGGAWWLRSSAYLREPILRSKNLTELQEAVAAQPNDALTRYYLAKSFYLQGRFAEARDAYEAAARLDPNSSRVQLGLALSLYELGDRRKTYDAFEQVLRLDNKSAWAEYMLGKLLWLNGDVKSALPHVLRATELDARSDQAWYGLAVCYAQMRRYNDAIAALRQALTRRETSPQYHTALGEMLVYRGYADEGKKHYARALELKPDYGPACALMGGFYLRNGTEPDALDRAETLLLQATQLKTTRPADVWLDLGQVYTRKGQFPKAVTALQKAVAEDPRDERIYYALASAYRRGGNAKNAADTEARFRHISALHVRMQDLEARLSHAPNDAAAHLELARVLRDLGLYDKAAAHYTAAANLPPNSAAVAEERRQFLAEHTPAPDAQNQDFVLPPLPK